MRGGTPIAGQGPAGEVLTRPPHPYTKRWCNLPGATSVSFRQ